LKLLESNFALSDGTFVHVRPIRPENDDTLVEIFNHSSPRTIYQRFFTPLPALMPSVVRYLSNVDYVYRLALIAEIGIEPVGVARYERTNDPGLVELALIVVDDWQNRGIGRILLRKLLRAAEGNGIHRFCADVLSDNRRMMHLLSTECQIQKRKTEAGVTTVSLISRHPESGS
jgi:RimJ/RimL family protein N-acetyltransferase